MGDRIGLCLRSLLLALLLTVVVAASHSDSSSLSNGTSSRGVSYLREKPQHVTHLLKRQKRWLLFEPGSAVLLTANCAKAVLHTIPRGLILLGEITSIYSLPSAVGDFFPKRRRKPTPPPPPPPTPPPPPPPPPAAPKVADLSSATSATYPLLHAATPPLIVPQQPSIFPLSPTDPVHSFYYSYPQLSPVRSHRKSYTPRRPFSCPGSKLGKDSYGNYYCLPTSMTRRLGRELKSNGAKLLNEGKSPYGVLFDLLILLSEIHQYQPRYCIMRTLCESRHLLAPPGQLLFHDIFRILLRYVYPEIAHKPPYLKAFTSGHSLDQCAQWYGAHCPQSFLVNFGELFHSKLFNIGYSEKFIKNFI